MATAEQVQRYKQYWRNKIGDAQIEWLMEITKKPEIEVDNAILASVRKDETGKLRDNSLWEVERYITNAYKMRHCREEGHFFGCECNGNPRSCPHSRNFYVVKAIRDEQTGDLVKFIFGGDTCAKAKAFLQSTLERDTAKPTGKDLDEEVSGFY